VCDQNNLSACTVKIANTQISIIEYSTSGVPTILCTNQTLTQASANSINPYVYSFSCAVQGGAYVGTWYVAPLIVNGITALMLSEYNASLNANNDGTDAIAFLQAAFSPNGNYNYLYSKSATTQVGITTAVFTANTITNSISGTCNGAACAIIQGRFYNFAMPGFAYYSVNGTTNYNVVGDDTMNIYVDSFMGFYY